GTRSRREFKSLVSSRLYLSVVSSRKFETRLGLVSSRVNKKLPSMIVFKNFSIFLKVWEKTETNIHSNVQMTNFTSIDYFLTILETFDRLAEQSLVSSAKIETRLNIGRVSNFRDETRREYMAFLRKI